jgi:SAM-dependent methyltransferase
MTKDKFSFYKEYPKTCDSEDFWGQVKRTVNGVPVSQDQIDLIVSSVTSGLDLNKEDILLDLCCGNGALSNLLFNYCNKGIGVDFSEYLISIANKHFKSANCDYFLDDVIDFCRTLASAKKITKAVCYGSFSYLEKSRAEELLFLLGVNFKNLTHVYIGNCPDKSKLESFFSPETYVSGIEDDPDSPIGIWRSKEDFISLARKCGWNILIKNMPDTYYAASYRFDVVLYR